METVNHHIDRIETELKKLHEMEMKYGEDLENTAEEVDRCKTKQEMCKERVDNLKVDCEKLELQYSKEILQSEELKKKKREADELQIHLAEEIAKMTRTGRQPRPKPSRKPQNGIIEDESDGSKSPNSSALGFTAMKPNLSVIMSHESQE